MIRSPFTRITLMLGSLIFLAGCQYLENKSDFERYVDSLGEVGLPMEYNTFENVISVSKGYHKELYRTFKHSYANSPIGIVFRTNHTTVIADGVAADLCFCPAYISYDSLGNKIDSLIPYEVSVQDYGLYGIEYVTFSDEGKITVIDTLKKWDKHPNGSEIIPESIVMTTDTTVYQVQEDGTFKLISHTAPTLRR